MTRFGKFIVLALVGFGLGAGLAYYQHTLDSASTSDIVAGAPEMPVAGDNTVAADTVAGSTVGGAFSLVDHNNMPVTEATYAGKMKLVFFGFTNCPDICPATLDKLSTALNMVGTDSDKLQVLFITTDVARDTPEAMKAYLEKYPTFTGLTGTAEQIKAAEEAYKVYAVPAADGSGNIDHSAYVYLMSADNKLLDTFGKDDTAEAISEKLKARIAEAPAAAAETPATEAPAADAAVAPAAEAPVADVPAATTETTAPAAESTEAPAADAPAADTAAPAAEQPAQPDAEE